MTDSNFRRSVMTAAMSIVIAIPIFSVLVFFIVRWALLVEARSIAAATIGTLQCLEKIEQKEMQP